MGIKEALTVNKFNSINNDTIKKVVLGYVKDNGYIKGDYGYHNNNFTSYRGSPTVAELKRIFDEGNYDDYLVPDNVLDEMDNWVNHLDFSNVRLADYFRRCQEIWEKPHVDKDDLSILASMCNTFFQNKRFAQRRAEQQAERERQQQVHQARLESPANRFAGNVGDTVEFEIAEAGIDRWIDPPTNYTSSYPLWKIKDAEGLVYTWGDTKEETTLEPGMRVRAKIRRQNEYRGIKETQIWRLEVLGQNNHQANQQPEENEPQQGVALGKF